MISKEIFSNHYPSPAVISAEANERVLFLTKPMMKGEDVKRLQRALGFTEEKIDGVFENRLIRLSVIFRRLMTKIDGKAGPATWAELGY